MNTVQERIQLITQETGKNLAQLANIAGLSRAAASKWNKGLVSTIQPDGAYRLEDELGYSARWIMLGEGPKLAKEVYCRYSKRTQAIAEILEALDEEAFSSVQGSIEREKQLKDLREQLSKKAC